jgi:hypothetical protein
MVSQKETFKKNGGRSGSVKGSSLGAKPCLANPTPTLEPLRSKPEGMKGHETS